MFQIFTVFFLIASINAMVSAPIIPSLIEKIKAKVSLKLIDTAPNFFVEDIDQIITSVGLDLSFPSQTFFWAEYQKVRMIPENEIYLEWDDEFDVPIQSISVRRKRQNKEKFKKLKEKFAVYLIENQIYVNDSDALKELSLFILALGSRMIRPININCLSEESFKILVSVIDGESELLDVFDFAIKIELLEDFMQGAGIIHDSDAIYSKCLESFRLDKTFFYLEWVVYKICKGQIEMSNAKVVGLILSIMESAKYLKCNVIAEMIHKFVEEASSLFPDLKSDRFAFLYL